MIRRSNSSTSLNKIVQGVPMWDSSDPNRNPPPIPPNPSAKMNTHERSSPSRSAGPLWSSGSSERKETLPGQFEAMLESIIDKSDSIRERLKHVDHNIKLNQIEFQNLSDRSKDNASHLKTLSNCVKMAESISRKSEGLLVETNSSLQQTIDSNKQITDSISKLQQIMNLALQNADKNENEVINGIRASLESFIVRQFEILQEKITESTDIIMSCVQQQAGQVDLSEKLEVLNDLEKIFETQKLSLTDDFSRMIDLQMKETAQPYKLLESNLRELEETNKSNLQSISAMIFKLQDQSIASDSSTTAQLDTLKTTIEEKLNVIQDKVDRISVEEEKQAQPIIQEDMLVEKITEGVSGTFKSAFEQLSPITKQDLESMADTLQNSVQSCKLGSVEGTSAMEESLKSFSSENVFKLNASTASILETIHDTENGVSKSIQIATESICETQKTEAEKVQKALEQHSAVYSNQMTKLFEEYQQQMLAQFEALRLSTSAAQENSSKQAELKEETAEVNNLKSELAEREIRVQKLESELKELREKEEVQESIKKLHEKELLLTGNLEKLKTAYELRLEQFEALERRYSALQDKLNSDLIGKYKALLSSSTNILESINNVSTSQDSSRNADRRKKNKQALRSASSYIPGSPLAELQSRKGFSVREETNEMSFSSYNSDDNEEVDKYIAKQAVPKPSDKENIQNDLFVTKRNNSSKKSKSKNSPVTGSSPVSVTNVSIASAPSAGSQ